MPKGKKNKNPADKSRRKVAAYRHWRENVKPKQPSPRPAQFTPGKLYNFVGSTHKKYRAQKDGSIRREHG